MMYVLNAKIIVTTQVNRHRGTKAQRHKLGEPFRNLIYFSN